MAVNVAEENADQQNVVEENVAEKHRAIVRELNDQMGRAYGFGGGFALLSILSVLAMGYFLNLLATVALYMVTLTVGLIALFVARSRIYRHRRALRERARAYCEANGICVESMTAYYAADALYPFFGALFEPDPTQGPS
jgi:hypothetical protein